MFAIAGLATLLALIYARPQEFYEPLQAVPVLYIAFGLAVFGILLDAKLRNTRPFATPQLVWALLFFVWAMVTALIRTPRTVHRLGLELAISVVLYLIIAHGVQSFRALKTIGCVALAMVVFVVGVGVHQGFAEYGCVLVDEKVMRDQTSGIPDGRPCAAPAECYLGDAEPGGQYLCERVGLFGTTSISKGRVRYRGVLQDPNELALVGSIGLPLAFALGHRRRAFSRFGLAAALLLLIAACVVLTRSRGGQLVFLAVLGAYFVKRFGARGLLSAGVAAIPVVVLGGRTSSEASNSTLERADCWYEAISMWRSHPLLGVGFGQFGEYHYLTAHNAYLLTLAELGPLGMLLFSIVVYTSAKVPVAVLQRYRDAAVEASVARAWAMALVAAFAGIVVGIFFLSFAYHYVLWIYVGLSGALYSAVRSHDPAFQVRFGFRDLLIVGLVDTAMVVFTYVLWRYIAL